MTPKEPTSNEPMFTAGLGSSTSKRDLDAANKSENIYSSIMLPSSSFMPLQIDPERFIENYNLPIEHLVDRHTFKEKSQKGAGDSSAILYLSYPHAIRLFRQSFPGWEAKCEMNPVSGGYVFKEIDNRGYFLKAYVTDGIRRSESIYFAVLSSANSTVFPADKDRNSNPVGNAQLFNKCYYRAIVKAIAWVTGIGLKLWTGDDLNTEIQDAKYTLINKVREMADRYEHKFGKVFELPVLDYTTSDTDIRKYGKILMQELKKEPSSPELKSAEVTLDMKTETTADTTNKAPLLLEDN